MLDIAGRDMGGEGARNVTLSIEAIDEIIDDRAIVSRLCDGHGRQRHQRKTKDGRQMPHSAPSFIRDTAWSQARAVSAI